MAFFRVTAARRSVRRFKDRAVDDATLKRILETASRAPSAGNLQAYEIVVVRDAARRAALARAALGQQQVAQAPVVLVFLAHPARSSTKYGKRGAELYCIQDATIACAHAQLAVTAVGLGSCWVGAFKPNAVRAAVKARSTLVPVALLPLGHSAERPPATGRRSLSELVHKETL